MQKNYRIFNRKIAGFKGVYQLSVLFLTVITSLGFTGVVSADTGPESEAEILAVQACDVFQESNGIVVIQAEAKTNGWSKKTSGGFSYIEWTGKEFFGNPSAGKITYKIKFNNPGIYKFVWRNKINHGNQTSEHNDTWLKFPNSSNITFFGHRGNANNVASDLKAKKNVVFPRGSGITPYPAGASSQGYFKVYMNRKDWRWIASTSDHNPHDIYVEVKQAGTYDMQIAARSYKHAIDGMILHHIQKQGTKLSDGTLDNLLKSVKDCSDLPDDPTPDPDPEPEPGNSAPVIDPVADQTIEAGKKMNLKITIKDQDNDNINLVCDIKKGGATVPQSEYTFLVKKKGQVGRLKLNTDDGDEGKLDVTIVASDGQSSTEEKFSIQIIGDGNPDPDPDPDPNPGNGNLDIYLVNTTNNQDIKKLENNSSFAVGPVGIRVGVGVQVTKGVRFVLTGGPDNMKYRNKEGNQPPYSLFGDIGNKINPWKNLKPGNYNLLVEVRKTNAKKSINFTVTGGNSSPVAREGQTVTKQKDPEVLVDEQLYADFKIAKLYPNPVAEELIVEYSGSAEKSSISLYLVNRLGVSFPLDAKSYQVEGNKIKVTMGNLNLSGGVYLLKIENANTGKAEVFRLIKY